MPASSKRDHFSTVYYWTWDVWEGQLLRPNYCFVFSTNFLLRRLSANWLNDSLNDYFVSEILSRISIIRKSI